MPTQSFAELGVSRAVVNALNSQGVSEPFEIQSMVTHDVLAGRDVLVRSPTGSGKTLAFGIPLVDLIEADGPRPAALILAPTRELATQITDEIRGIAHARALRVTAVYGGVGLVKQAENAARSHIIVATPGRLEDLLQRRSFSLKQIQVLVLDEADRMLDMGFRPAVDRIVAACPAKRQTLFFSATLDGEAGTIARSYTNNPASHERGPSKRAANAEIEHRFVSITHEERLDALVTELEAPGRELTLVFVRTKRGADRLVKRLSARDIDAVAMHGDKSQRQRERALSDFENWKVDTLVATDVAARGIDVQGISHVINFDPPEDDESYVHRVGRTARAGNTGVAVTLVAQAERGDVVKLATRLGIDHGLGGGGGQGGSAPRTAGRSSERPQGARGQRPQGGRGERAQNGRGPRSQSGRDERPESGREDRGSRQGQRPQGRHGGPDKPARQDPRADARPRPHASTQGEHSEAHDGPRRRRRRRRPRTAQQ